MNHYPHHIGDFNNATRHLNRLERSIYRDLIDIYYDTEKPLILDIDLLCRKIIAISEQEITAVKQVLNEFFVLSDLGYENSRCEKDIDFYQNSIHNKSKAGKASAKARKARKTKAPKNQQKSTPVQQPLNSSSTGVNNQNQNQNQNQDNNCSELINQPLLCSFKCTKGELFHVYQNDFDEWVDAYPAVDVILDLKAANQWLKSNPKKIKTVSGMPKFINGWLSRTQNKGGNRNDKNNQPNSEQDGENWFSELAESGWQPSQH